MSSEPLLNQLTDALRCLPGVGPKSAQRMALHLLERNREGGVKLSGVLAEAMEKIGRCQQCRDLTELKICSICSNARRDQSLLCVVESPVDVLSIEQATAYQVLYFVLLGRLSPLDGIGPAELVVIPGVGHLTPAEAPDTFNGLVRTFLSARSNVPA